MSIQKVIPTVGDVMTASPATISATATLSEAKSMMTSLQINHLPVVDGSLVETIISDKDIKRFTLPAHRISPDEELLVGDIAPDHVLVADVNDPLDKVLDSMTKQHLSAVFVLKNGELAGIFTETDSCRLLAQYLSGSEEP